MSFDETKTKRIAKYTRLKQIWDQKLKQRNQMKENKFNVTKLNEKSESNLKIQTLKTSVDSVNQKLNDLSLTSNEINKLQESFNNSVRPLFVEIAGDISNFERQKLQKLVEDIESKLRKINLKSKCLLQPIKFLNSRNKTAELSIESKKTNETIASKNIINDLNSREFRVQNKSNEHINIPSETIVTDIALENLTHCNVTILAKVSALRIKNVKHSTIKVKDCSTSALLFDIHYSECYICCSQLRLHDSSMLKMYLNITSKPIIENCSGISFGDLTLVKENLFQVNRRFSNKWNEVQDFKWLKKGKSPNWDIISD